MEAKEQHEKVYVERAKAKSIKNKVTASFTVGCMGSYQDRLGTKMMRVQARLTTP